MLGATIGESSYRLGELEQVIKDQIMTVLRQEIDPILGRSNSVFLHVYYPNLSQKRLLEKDYCDIDVNSLSVTDVGKSRFSST